MRGVIHVAPNASAADSDSARRRIDPRVFDRAQVNDQTVVANSQASGVMTSAADCDEQIIFSGKVYAANYVSHVRAPRDASLVQLESSPRGWSATTVPRCSSRPSRCISSAASSPQ